MNKINEQTETSSNKNQQFKEVQTRQISKPWFTFNTVQVKKLGPRVFPLGGNRRNERRYPKQKEESGDITASKENIVKKPIQEL